MSSQGLRGNEKPILAGRVRWLISLPNSSLAGWDNSANIFEPFFAAKPMGLCQGQRTFNA
jgi:hypothetical protein